MIAEEYICASWTLDAMNTLFTYVLYTICVCTMNPQSKLQYGCLGFKASRSLNDVT